MSILSILYSKILAISDYWRNSIRRQLMLGFGISTLFLMWVSGYFLYTEQRAALYRQDHEQAISLATALAKSSTSWVLANDLAGLAEVVSGLQDTKDLKRAFVISHHGEVLASTRPAEIGLFATDNISAQLLQSTQMHAQVLVDQAHFMDVAVPVTRNEEILGWVRVELTHDSANADLATLSDFLLRFALLAIFMIALTAALLAKGLLKRLNELITVTQQIKAGDHQVRATPSRQDEMGNLISNINDMLDVLCESELRFRQLAENIHEVFWISTPNKDEVLYVSPAYELVWGRTLQSLSAAPLEWRDAIHPEDRHWVEIAMLTKQLTGQYDEEYRIVRPNGDVRWVHDQAFLVHNTAGEVYRLVGVAEDITEQKQALFQLKVSEERLDFLAHHDPLTRLPNRLLMNVRLERAIEHAQKTDQKLAFLVLDLDRFKNINDSFGHTMGDEVLQKVAQRLTKKLHSSDNLSRIGGDEFTLLLENQYQVENVAQVAASLIETLNIPYNLSIGIQVSVGGSVGISIFPDHGNSAAELFQHADIALYRAKEEGRGRYQYFDEEMSLTVKRRIDLENRLREALDAGHLCVYYQPQVEINTGNIIGAEALVRWQDPERGLISPAQFISIAEESDLIDRIGHFVLLETCLQGQRWLQAGYAPLTLAVNLSPRQTLHSNVTTMVTDILQKTGYPADYLELELTESALMKHASDVIDMLNYLRSLGVRLAIDDFGTGYSSLSYLKRFPLDILKIDKSFIDDIPSHADGMELVTTIINMGHTLGFKVLAEGVETEAQRHFLRKHQCDIYQGYLTSKPVSPAQFEQQFLRRHDPIQT